MNQIRTRIVVGDDHRITGIVPDEVPPGEHEAVITIAQEPTHEDASRLADMPVHDTPWDGSISLHRENMYGDDGR